MTKAQANKRNSLKSTGPKTPEGKAVVSINGIRHGILSQRLLLASERPEEFGELAQSLQAALRPMGALEAVLVEKIATAIWRQRRLVAAETASIELMRRLERDDNRRAIEGATDLGYGQFHPATYSADLTEDELVQVKWCRDVLAEFQALDDAVLDANDCKRLEAEAPELFGQLTREATEQGEAVEVFIGTKMREWAEDMEKWCGSELRKLEHKPVVVAVAALVQERESAPVSNELLCRYQTALDGELYKAMRALREQQEWRMRGGIEVQAEAA